MALKPIKKKSNFNKELNLLIEEKYRGKITGSKEMVFKADKKRLESNEPIDYIIGFSRFLDCKIDLSLKSMIPRPETEFWVEKAIEEISKKEKRRKVHCLDIFSGSGCIGIAVLRALKNAKVDFSDKSENCLKQAKINLKLNRIKTSRFKLIKSDIFKNIKRKYDYVFANPPYVAKSKINRVQKSVLEFEPKTALFGAKDGLFHIRRFLKEAKNHLKLGGVIYLEFDSWQKKPIEKILKKHGCQAEFFKDQYDKWRYLKTTENSSRDIEQIKGK